jgi:hypothetical protein
MFLCCIPIAIAAVVLVATGTMSASFFIIAAGCIGMMALMMRGMSTGRTKTSHD